MAEDPTPAGQEPETPNDPPGETPEEEAFDKERALNTIRTLRAAEKASKAQARELEQLKTKVAEHEQAQLSAAEKAELRAQDAERKAQAAEAKAKAISLRASVERHAHRLNVIDDDAAYRLLDLAAVEYDEAGEPQNVEALMKALVKDRPSLVAAEQKNGIPATPKPTDRQALSDAEQQANRERFATQVRSMFR
jgi:hypothetical protein